MIENILFFVFVWISFLSAVRLTDFPITAKKLHLRNVDRYFTSPIFANGSQGSEFACFLRSGSEKHENIMRNTKTELVDMRMALPYLRNKTILFMGDSLMRNQFSALVAQIWEADETCLHYDGSNESFPGYLKPRTVHTARRSSALHCFKYNLQVQYLFSTTLLDLSNENLMQLSAETKVFKSWSELMKGQHDWRVPDTVVLSTGHYWGQYSYKMEFNGSHFEVDLDLFALGLNNINRYIKEQNLTAVWRSVPAQHYENGDWDTGGYCLHSVPNTYEEVLQMLAYSKNRGWAKKALELSSVIHDIALSGNFHFLDVLGITLIRRDGLVATSHYAAKMDCVHYCVPGIPDIWNSKMLRDFFLPPETTS